MTFVFDENCRERVAGLCAGFERLPDDDSGRHLKRAAVAITLVEAESVRVRPPFCSPSGPASCARMAGSGRCRAGAATKARRSPKPHCANSTEELGLRLGQDSVLGLLDDYPTRSGYLYSTPVVLWAGSGARVLPNPDEVASVHRIPLRDIAPDDAVSFVSIPESDRPIVRIWINGNHVNAPTAALIYQFREMLAGRLTRVVAYEQPVFAWR